MSEWHAHVYCSCFQRGLTIEPPYPRFELTVNRFGVVTLVNSSNHAEDLDPLTAVLLDRIVAADKCFPRTLSDLFIASVKTGNPVIADCNGTVGGAWLPMNYSNVRGSRYLHDQATQRPCKCDVPPMRNRVHWFASAAQRPLVASSTSNFVERDVSAAVPALPTQNRWNRHDQPCQARANHAHQPRIPQHLSVVLIPYTRVNVSQQHRTVSRERADVNNRR